MRNEVSITHIFSAGGIFDMGKIFYPAQANHVQYPNRQIVNSERARALHVSKSKKMV